jgi:hypothetical protein
MATKKENKKFQEQQRLAAIRRKKELKLNRSTDTPSGPENSMTPDTPTMAQRELDLSRVKSISGGGPPKTPRGNNYRPSYGGQNRGPRNRS